MWNASLALSGIKQNLELTICVANLEGTNERGRTMCGCVAVGCCVLQSGVLLCCRVCGCASWADPLLNVVVRCPMNVACRVLRSLLVVVGRCERGVVGVVVKGPVS